MGISGATGSAEMNFDDFSPTNPDPGSWWAHAPVRPEELRVPARPVFRPPVCSKESKKEEKQTLKMKEELTLCSEKLWN